MKHANLVRKRSVRRHVIIRRILTIPERPDQLWQQDITYIWVAMMGGAICLASWTVIQENGWRTHSAPSVVQ